MNVEMKMSKLLLVLLTLTIQFCFVYLGNGAASSVYCVFPDNKVDDVNLPRLFCLKITLTQLLTNPSSYFKSSATIIFLPGQHHIVYSNRLTVSNIDNLVITGISHKVVNGSNDLLPEIVCNSSQRSGFMFKNGRNIEITQLSFSNCGLFMLCEFNEVPTHTKFGEVATLFFANMMNLTMKKVIVQNGNGYGIFGMNVLGHSVISQSFLTKNTNGGNVFLRYIDLDFTAVCVMVHHLLIQDTSIKHGESILRLTSPVSDIGAGISVELEQTTFAVNITVLKTNASNNVARIGPNFLFRSNSTAPNLITVKQCIVSHGTVLFGGASGFQYSYLQLLPTHLHPCENSGIQNGTYIQLISNHFVDSIGAFDPSLLNDYTSTALGFTFFVIDSTSVPHDISVVDCTVRNNTGGNGIGLYSETFFVSSATTTKNIKLQIINSLFVNNTSTALRNSRRSVLLLIQMFYMLISNVTIAHNTGTGLLSDGSIVYVEGINMFKNNFGYNGGGLALYGQTFIYLKPNTLFSLIGNVAENVGGGMYIAKTIDSTIKTQCFIQFTDMHMYNTVSVDLKNNLAGLAGNDLYGGSLETCLINGFQPGWKIFPLVAGLLRDGYVPDISSKPTRVCLCNSTNLEPNCSVFVHSISAYPGSLFNINAVAVGQMLCLYPAGSPSAIYGTLLPIENSLFQGSIPDEMIVQEAGRYCSVLTYQINSLNKNEVIVLTVEKSREQSPSSLKVISKAKYWCTFEHEALDLYLELPVYINVTLLPCPLGFELYPDGKCDCASALKKQDIVCSINKETIHRTFPMWIGTRHSHNGTLLVYITHLNCPFHYCIQGDIDFHVNNSDMQCAFNRSGVLCGSCKNKLSNVLGGMECRECSNVYLFLLIPFAFAGVLLILLLMVTNLTVTVGTTNGLLFFANIVRENQSTFFLPSMDANVLTVFIAWINLDFGITSCFFNGMDTYAKAWLQYLFPLYLWVLAAMIIISSRHLPFISKLCSKNIVQVLATLFLLSYTKLQRAIITGLSFTLITESTNHTQAVWLPDPSLSYLQDKHIYLFIASITVFMLLFLPYTLMILFGPCLLSKSNYKVLSIVQRLKPLFDAYLGPYKDKHRNWTGLLLFARTTLVVISAVNVFGDPSVNLLAVAVVSYILTILVWQSGGVYKTWVLTALESFSLLNVGLISTVTLYIQKNGGNQFIAVHLSCGIAFTVFLAVLLYHTLIYTPIKFTKRKIWTSLRSLLLGTSFGKLCSQAILKQCSLCGDSNQSDELELTEARSMSFGTSRDAEVSLEPVDWDCNHGNQTGTREVTSMLISFNESREPTFECGMVYR